MHITMRGMKVPTVIPIPPPILFPLTRTEKPVPIQAIFKNKHKKKISPIQLIPLYLVKKILNAKYIRFIENNIQRARLNPRCISPNSVLSVEKNSSFKASTTA